MDPVSTLDEQTHRRYAGCLVRLGLAEGITDFEVLKAAIESMLAGRSFDLKLLQPEGSVAFTGAGAAGQFGGGWKGVYKWCLQAATRNGGSVRNDPLFRTYDLLIMHLDADVASEDPANYHVNPIAELSGVLPCEMPCPPPNETTDRLRQVLLSWVSEVRVPPRTVLCTPSKCTEAWIVAIFFPHDGQMIKWGWECHPRPETRLGQQPKGQRFAKSWLDYQARAAQIQEGWPRIVSRLTEARRFQEEFMTAVSATPIFRA
jgi:hypothetical protein